MAQERETKQIIRRRERMKKLTYNGKPEVIYYRSKLLILRITDDV